MTVLEGVNCTPTDTLIGSLIVTECSATAHQMNLSYW